MKAEMQYPEPQGKVLPAFMSPALVFMEGQQQQDRLEAREPQNEDSQSVKSLGTESLYIFP